ncbi:hypothetical protein QV13_19230 [Mesorhizobium hungaricum]|uniref:Uncharacterized protein n=1 Tax=Mesorhizobium hungaricum TaxID=1566387 RepID=A0A1C2DIN9_9HYPH|nr:hypothetical protein QV13_19230 [Mesorhizobium hungaricum]
MIEPLMASCEIFIPFCRALVKMQFGVGSLSDPTRGWVGGYEIRGADWHRQLPFDALVRRRRLG